MGGERLNPLLNTNSASLARVAVSSWPTNARGANIRHHSMVGVSGDPGERHRGSGGHPTHRHGHPFANGTSHQVFSILLPRSRNRRVCLFQDRKIVEACIAPGSHIQPASAEGRNEWNAEGIAGERRV